MEKLKELLLLLAAIALLAGCAAPEKRHSPAELQAYRPQDFSWPAAAQAAERARLEVERARIRERLALPAGAEREAQLPAALAAIMLFNIEVDAGRAPLLAALPGLGSAAPEQQRALLTAAHTLYATEAAPLMAPLLPQLRGAREFAIAAHVVLKADASAAAALKAALHRRPDCCTEPRLEALDLALDQALGAVAAPQPPALDVLLAAPLKPGLPVVFSLQRPGRQVQGLALVRGADGRFVRDTDGRPFAVPQLALARSGLPGTLTYGNTPRGLFTVRGAGTAENPWIGPTPYLHSMLPVEASVAEFLHEPEAGKTWREADYRELLPPSWAAQLREAWLAGRAGRSEILMHGTTISPAYYRGEPYFPGTPSAGCLVTDERWSAVDGQLLASDQLRLAQAFTAGGQDRGYLVVAEIGGGPGPVRLDEVLDALTAAEQKLKGAGR